jgi:hypothetical protein
LYDEARIAGVKIYRKNRANRHGVPAIVVNRIFLAAGSRRMIDARICGLPFNRAG